MKPQTKLNKLILELERCAERNEVDADIKDPAWITLSAIRSEAVAVEQRRIIKKLKAINLSIGVFNEP